MAYYYTLDRFNNSKILKSPLKLIGAKTRIRDFLYQYIPKDVDIWIEPFMGTAGVTIGSPIHDMEFVGDLNQYAVNFSYKQTIS